MNINSHIIMNFSALTCFKSLVILALFFLNIFLYLNLSKSDSVLQSGFGNDKVVKLLNLILGAATLYSTHLAVKSDKFNEIEKELLNNKIKEIEKEHLDAAVELRKEITSQQINNIHLSEFVNNITESIEKTDHYRDKFFSDIDMSDSAKKLIIEQIKVEAGYRIKVKEQFIKDHPEYKEALEVLKNNPDSSSSNLIFETDEINKSFIFSRLIEQFENMNTISKLAISLLITKSILLSSLISIIFVLYGDYLIKKYELESRFPKLERIIKLRRAFQKYYLIFDGLIIFTIILMEVIFCISILY
jgi:hypothetical protein